MSRIQFGSYEKDGGTVIAPAKDGLVHGYVALDDGALRSFCAARHEPSRVLSLDGKDDGLFFCSACVPAIAEAIGADVDEFVEELRRLQQEEEGSATQ